MLILTCAEPWAVAAKTFLADGGVVPYRLGGTFTGRQWDPASGEEMARDLAALRGDPRSFVVRGDLAAHVDGSKPFRRRYLGGAAATDRPAVVNASGRVVCVDFDSGTIGPSTSPADAARKALERIHAVCPTAVGGTVVVHLSASHTSEDGRAHVWIYLSHLATNRALRTAFGGIGDRALYNPVQPHYTADAIRATPDPYAAGRFLVLDCGGEASISVARDLSADAEASLDSWCRRITKAKEGDRHAVINKAAYLLGQDIGAGYIEHDRVKTALTIAAMAAGFPASRADEVTRAIGDGMRKPKVAGESWRDKLTRDTKSNAVKSTEINAYRILTEDPRHAGRIGVDTMLREPVWIDPPEGSKPGAIVSDADLLRLADGLEVEHRVSFSTASLRSVVAAVAEEEPIDPLTEWLESQPWDGKRRLEEALSTVFGCEDTPYMRGASKALFLGLATRILRPGAQHDFVHVFESQQHGVGKTSFLRALGGPYYAEVGGFNDEIVYSMRAAAVIEIGELSQMSEREVARAKSLITRDVDVYRGKYERSAGRVPRRCIFCATTNEGGYHTDMTGGRRWLPIQVKGYDRAAVAGLMGLFLGEARERFRDGETYHEVPDAASEQAAILVEDPWLDHIREYVKTRDSFTMRDILASFGITVDKQRAYEARRAGGILRVLGWEQSRSHAKRAWVKVPT